MKKLLSNYPEKALEIAKRLAYSLKVLVIGLFIPFAFVFGITYNRHIEDTQSKVLTNDSYKVATGTTFIWAAKILPDQNS